MLDVNFEESSYTFIEGEPSTDICLTITGAITTNLENNVMIEQSVEFSELQVDLRGLKTGGWGLGGIGRLGGGSRGVKGWGEGARKVRGRKGLI